MALLDKLFPNRIFEYDNREARKRDRPHQITPEQVRLLLFKECDWRGRKLLFDSSTIQKVPAGKNDKPNRQMDEPPCIVEVSDGFTYVYKGPAVDASVLGEMIFGAVAMNYKGVSLKIHIMDDPRRLMCTKVFCVPTSRRYSRAEKRPSEVASGDVLHGSKPMTVPALREEGVALSFSLDRGDSGFCGDVSPHSSVGSTYDYFSMFDIWDENNSQEDFFFHCPPGRKLSTSSNGSWQRRTFQNIVTRFDLGHQPTSSSNLLSVPTAASNASDSQVYSNSSTSGTNESLSSCVNLPQRKNKLGLAVLITVSECSEMDEVRKCVEHSPQLQALVCRLRLATLAAGAGNNFVSTLHRASTDAARCLSDLLYGPRLQPAWLRLVTGEPRAASKVADALLADLCSVLSVGETKHTNFFISTLLTYVLTYHLGWVTTVSPYDTPQLAPPAQEPRRPYNALWAQLGDLCGAIGFPPRAARTIISGINNSYVNRLLVVLTYFVRSGDVRRTDFTYQFSGVKETKVINVDSEVIGDSVQTTLKRTATVNKLGEVSGLSVAVNSDSVNTLASDVSMRRVTTLADFDKQLSSSTGHLPSSTAHDRPASSPMKRTPTMLLPIKSASDSSLSSVSDEPEPEKSVVFVLGDNEKLVGLKNKSNNPRSVKKSSKVHNEPIDLAEVRKADEKTEVCSKDNFDVQSKNTGSPSKCCGQTLQHSKPIKHSGFKFEFDKYPQIVTNYMKSKNLEILDRHYIGKPGNLKLANFHFDPTTVPPIQEERCEICYKCQQIESMLQTPTNASEMEYMNDMPRQAEPQHATESMVSGMESHREISPKTFVRERKQNTIVVNINRRLESPPKVSVDAPRERERTRAREASVRVRRVVELEMPSLCAVPASPLSRSGFDASLLGGVTDHYVPDLILQGTNTKPHVWELDLRRDLDMTSHLNKGLDSPVQAVAIVGDTNTWEVRVVGRSVSAGGMSSLVGAMLDALPAMRKANVPAHQCLSFLESKLREFCILSKTLADMLMSTDFCDIATLTKSLNIDVNDVPLLLAVASTHTPQVATRYGISYR